jgi:hypothetical protein
LRVGVRGRFCGGLRKKGLGVFFCFYLPGAVTVSVVVLVVVVVLCFLLAAAAV